MTEWFDKILVGTEVSPKILQDALGELSSFNLLDIGSSTGIMTNEYSKYFTNTVGIDIDQEAVEFSKKNYKKESLEFLCVPIEELDYSDGHFDVITCSHDVMPLSVSRQSISIFIFL